jgi:hypothetical protein
MLPRVFESNLAPKERLIVAYPLIQWFLTLSFAAGYLFGIPAMLLIPSIAWPLGITLYLAYVLTFLVVLLMMWGGSRAAGRRLDWRLIIDVVPLTYIVLYVSWARFWSMPSIMLGRKAVFVRTPKQGVSASNS